MVHAKKGLSLARRRTRRGERIAIRDVVPERNENAARYENDGDLRPLVMYTRRWNDRGCGVKHIAPDLS